MALEIEKIIPSGVAVTGARYRVTKESGTLLKSGVVDVINNSGDFQVNIPLVGLPVVLGERMELIVDDDDGGGINPVFASISRVLVTDDGIAPPSVFRFMALGDSHTDLGSSGTTTGDRPSHEDVGLNMTGYWVSMAYMHCVSDYIFRPDMGQSGQGTQGLINRLTSVTDRAGEVDLILLMIGTNDATESGGDITQTKANYDTIVTALVSAGFKVLIAPVFYRDDFGDNTLPNAFYDDLNAHCITIAATFGEVEILPVYDALNVLITTGGDVMDAARLHLNNNGGSLLGNYWAPFLDSFYPSTLASKISVLPAEFAGTSGSLGAGATGTTPDDMRGVFGNNSTEDGFQSVDRGDGRKWWKIRTNGGTPVSSNNFAEFQNDYVNVPAGLYVAECVVEIETPNVVSRIKLSASDAGLTYYDCTTSTFNLTDADIYEVGVEHRLRTPSAFFEAGDARMVFQSVQNMGADAIIYVTDFKLYKVEELPI